MNGAGAANAVVDAVLLHVVVVVFVATLIRSALGFGEALVAVPLLALRIPIQVAAPLAVLVSITVAAIVLVQDWREVQVRSAGWLVLATLALGRAVNRWLRGRDFMRWAYGGLVVTALALLAQSLAG